MKVESNKMQTVYTCQNVTNNSVSIAISSMYSVQNVQNQLLTAAMDGKTFQVNQGKLAYQLQLTF